MSGPFCKSCAFFYRPPLCPKDQGECHDPSKIIFVGGRALNSAPDTWVLGECSNWTDRLTRNEEVRK